MYISHHDFVFKVIQSLLILMEIGQTLRDYVQSGESANGIYFRSKVHHLNSERQEFYRLVQKPSSINENLVDVFASSDEKGRNEKKERVSLLLWQHLDDPIVSIDSLILKAE